MRNIKRLLLRVSIFSALLLAVVPSLPAKAADFNLTASPLPIDLTTKPGGTITTPLRIQNTGTEPVKVKVTLQKFKANGDTGKPEILPPSPTDEFVKWVSFSESSFTAQPNVWHTITMTIRAPKEAAFGYYYAVLFSQEGGQQIVSNRQHSVVNGAVATLVLLDVNAPGEKRTLSVKSFAVTKKLYDYLPVTFRITVHNSGNVHAVPFGDVFVGKNKKQSITHIPLNSSGGNILPGTDRAFEVNWTDGFPSYQTKKANGVALTGKDGKPIKSLEWSGASFNKFRIGKYYAHLVLTYNDGKRDIPVEGDVSFWVVPWKLLLIGFVVLLLVLAGLYAVSRSIIKRIRIIRSKK